MELTGYFLLLFPLQRGVYINPPTNLTFPGSVLLNFKAVLALLILEALPVFGAAAA